jgi:hypothetical protein
VRLELRAIYLLGRCSYCHATALVLWWVFSYMVSQIICLGLVLNLNPLISCFLSRITGMSHWGLSCLLL